MTEDGSLAAGQDGRHPTSLLAQAGMSNRVHTTINAVKAAGGDPALDGAGVQAGEAQLRYR
jgi:hypothetical protein